jgi:hypothetical protein
MPATVRLQLPPERKRMAKSMLRLMDIIARSDAKAYARGKPFAPIFPTDNATLQAALTTVYTQLVDVLSP